ncbi:MAG TPA: hypothetical protein VJ798_02110 [Rhizomicrobium sp.]|nr:hypothetical protein [Rhizomicrobium sp.]
MSLRAAWEHLYPRSPSAPAGVDSHLKGEANSRDESGSATGDHALMKEYQEFVACQFNAQRESGRPGEIFQNRNTDHAKVVIPYLFIGAKKWVHLLTRTANAQVYASEEVITAAKNFLQEYPASEIKVLSEKKFDRAVHAFFIAIDENASMRDRTHLAFVPEDVQRDYKCNFGINDFGDYRFEASRNTEEAMVQFGERGFVAELERIFQDLFSASTKK